MKKFRNLYRIPSARAPFWDYSHEGSYFVTICTKHSQHFFGEIIDHEMHLTELGEKALAEWLLTPEIRPDMHITLGAFVVMPYHVHGILEIGANADNQKPTPSTDAMLRVSATPSENTALHEKVAHSADKPPLGQFAPQSKNLASILRGYKSAVTQYARINEIPFNWHVRYHDHIIRTDAAYQRIRDYILTNPENWGNDKYF